MAAALVYVVNFSLHGSEISIRQLGREGVDLAFIEEGEYFQDCLSFLRTYFAGIGGFGLAVGGVASPYLFNFYAEIFLDNHLRRFCENHQINYTRYADDLVFCRSRPIPYWLRREIRAFVQEASFGVNHRKSFVLSRGMGTVFVTKVGLKALPEDGSVLETPGECGPDVLVFPQKKRRRLHGAIGSYLKGQMDWPERVSGLVAEFIYHFKNVARPTKSDQKTFALCRAFKTEWDKYRSGVPRRIGRGDVGRNSRRMRR